MKSELTLEQMALLEKKSIREILKELLDGTKDFNSLCRNIEMSRSAIFGGLKDLMEVEMVDRKKIYDEKKGRPGFEYYIKSFHIPELTKTNLLDFLNGIDVTSKFITLTEISEIDNLSRYMPVSTEFFLNFILSSGITFIYAIQILVELGSQLDKNISYIDLIEKTLVIMKEKYPIDDKKLERFKRRSTKKIKVTSKNKEFNLTIEKTRNIAIRELGIEEFESEFMASNLLMTLRLLRISKIPYTTLVSFMYVYTQNISIPCKRIPYFYNIEKFPTLEGSIIHVILENKKEEWSLINFSNYLFRNKNLEKDTCNFIARLLIEKLLTIGLEKYDIKFIDSLSEEFIREFSI